MIFTHNLEQSKNVLNAIKMGFHILYIIAQLNTY